MDTTWGKGKDERVVVLGGGWVGHLKFRHGPGAELVPPTMQYSTVSHTYFTPVLRCTLGPLTSLVLIIELAVLTFGVRHRREMVRAW